MVPDSAACRAILDAYAVPEHIRRHSETVAAVAQAIAGGLTRAGASPSDASLIEPGALLHDIAKAACLDGVGDHAVEGGRILRSLGYPEIAELVERHVNLGTWDPEGEVTAAEVLNYSDKRVRHEEVVSLEERFRDLLERYGRESLAARARIQQTWELLQALERKIFDRLPAGFTLQR